MLVVGGGNSSCITSLYLSGLANQVTVVHRRAMFRAEESLVKDLTGKSNVKIMWNTEIQEIKGDRQVRTVALVDNLTGKMSEVTVDAVFVQVGEVPNSQLAAIAGVEIDEYGYIKIDICQHTNFEGVYGAGEWTNHPVKQAGTAVRMELLRRLKLMVSFGGPTTRQASNINPERFDYNLYAKRVPVSIK